jgi:hypothetical protein
MIAMSMAIFVATLSMPEDRIAFSFCGTGYVHRYSKGNLHEFTPKGKPDLKT